MPDDAEDYSVSSLLRGLFGMTEKPIAVDTDGNMKALIYGGSPAIIINVDAAGNIVSVMKGDHEGTLKTLDLDDQGRIRAVLSDPEDVFGNPHYMGSAELAARLGSIDIYQRQGQVICLDDFSDVSFKWSTDVGGATSAVTRSIDYAQSKDASAKLTAGNLTDNYASIVRKFTTTMTGKYGSEFAFSIDGENATLMHMFVLSSGSVRRTAAIQIVPSTNRMYYWGDAPGWVEFGGLIYMNANASAFNRIKLVVDIATDKYVKLYLNAREYDMSTYDMDHVGLLGGANGAATITHARADDSTGTMYVDDYIATCNEE